MWHAYLLVFISWNTLVACKFYLKSDFHLQKKLFQLLQESLSKMMKNALNVILNAPFALKIFKFLPWLWGDVEKIGLIRKIKLISKFVTSQPG